MNNAPKISVVMSVFNGAKYLESSISSIQNQTFDDFELIIINDCSTDTSLEIIHKYKKNDNRIIVIDNEVNLKLPASLNRGIAIARGKYIARMDADDIALPDRLRLQYHAMERRKDLDFIGGMVECFYDDDNHQDAYAEAAYMERVHFNFISASGDLDDTKKMIEEATFITTRICHSTLFGKTSAFRQLMYKEDIFAEDWDLYNRAINRGYNISKIPEVILKYRIVNSGMCGTFKELPSSELRRKVKKLNDGVLKDLIETKHYNKVLRFYWAHYIKADLSRLKQMLIRYARKIFYFFDPHSVSDYFNELIVRQLKFLKRLLEAGNRRAYIRNVPFLNRVISFGLKKLNAKKYVLYDKFNPEKPFFNIGVWTIEKKWAMGGLNTIFKMIPTLLQHGHKIRIINYGAHSEKLKKEFYNYISDIIPISKEDSNAIEIVSATTYRNNTKLFNPQDKFIAGYWEPAEDFISHRDLKHFEKDKFVYIIQDYEPSMLYRWGSEYVRSKDTLSDNNYYPIFNNSEFICSYIKQLGLIRSWTNEQMLHGEPCNTSPASPQRMMDDSKDIRLVFYSRPSVDKNIYTIKIKALKKLIDYAKHQMPELYSNLSITGIGEDAEDVVHNGFTIKNIGKVDFKEYPEMLKSFNVGLACIISPAFAYPCIEFPRSGIVTVVNRFENRDLERYSKNIISCDNNSDSIFNSLLKAIEQVPNIDDRISGSKFSLPGVSIDIATESMLLDMMG